MLLAGCNADLATSPTARLQPTDEGSRSISNAGDALIQLVDIEVTREGLSIDPCWLIARGIFNEYSPPVDNDYINRQKPEF